MEVPNFSNFFPFNLVVSGLKIYRLINLKAARAILSVILLVFLIAGTATKNPQQGQSKEKRAEHTLDGSSDIPKSDMKVTEKEQESKDLPIESSAREPEAESASGNGSVSTISFNFIHYLLYKFQVNEIFD